MYICITCAENYVRRFQNFLSLSTKTNGKMFHNAFLQSAHHRVSKIVFIKILMASQISLLMSQTASKIALISVNPQEMNQSRLLSLISSISHSQKRVKRFLPSNSARDLSSNLSGLSRSNGLRYGFFADSIYYYIFGNQVSKGH